MIVELINNSWEQTQVYILDEILKKISQLPTNVEVNVKAPEVIVNQPDIEVNVTPPEVIVNQPDINITIDNSSINENIEKLNDKIDNIKPVIVINKEPFSVDFRCREVIKNKKVKKTATILVNKKPVMESDINDWIIVYPSEVSSGYIENVFYNFGSYKVASNKLIWFVKDKVVRTILIKEPKENHKQFYLEAIEEAKAFGLDLTNYYRKKINKYI